MSRPATPEQLNAAGSAPFIAMLVFAAVAATAYLCTCGVMS